MQYIGIARINPYRNQSSIVNRDYLLNNMDNSNNNNNNNTSYKPFAEPKYIDENEVEDEIIDTLLSPGTDAQYESNLLMQLKQKLDAVPIDAKSSLMYAQQVTDFVDNDHLLGFLYAEHFNVDVSIYIQSWYCLSDDI